MAEIIRGHHNLKKWEKIEKRKEEEAIIKNDSFVNEYLQDFLKKTVITHTPTMARLLQEGRIGSDALTLYAFYCYSASRQRTTTVYATDYFCRNGLHWGEIKFRRAKNLLLKLKIITPKILREEETKKIIKYLIRIHYLKRPKKK